MIARSGTATQTLGATPRAHQKGRRLAYCLLLMALLLGAAILLNDRSNGFPTARPRSTAHWAQMYAALPLSFEANLGQTDPHVQFLARGRGYALFLTGREAVLTLEHPVSAAADRQQQPAPPATLRLQLLGANARSTATGTDELPGKANYFLGNDPSKWRTNIPTYARVKYESVYPGVDLVYYGTEGGELEYDFVVAPGAEPKAIALGVETSGRGVLQTNSEGDLVVPMGSGAVRLHRPLVYQEAKSEVQGPNRNGQANGEARQRIEGRYVLDAENHVRFDLGPYDRNRPLVIDPYLGYATYVGGTGGDTAYAIAVDSTTGDAYIAGSTNSTNFPTAGSAYQSSNKGNGDAFITKVNAAGTALIYSTYLGGSEADGATALALSNGSVLLTGYTSSVDFPTQVPVSGSNPFQLNYGGGTDAFVAELNTTGNALVYSSYLGGTGYDVGEGITVDSSGDAYVTGLTQSTNFPIAGTAPAPMQPTLNGSQNAFVTKVGTTGVSLVYSTFLGGSEQDSGQSIQVDSSGNAYIAGYSFSPNFVTVNPPSTTPIQSTIGGGADAFVCELNAAGSGLTFSTFLGGSGDDRAYGLAFDGSGNIYAAGTTSSTNFPTTSGVFQPSLTGASNAFVTKLNPAGASLLYSTYLGGSGTDSGKAIAVSSAGAAYVTGSTNSTNFPTQNPVQALLGLSSTTTFCQGVPCADAFVTQFNTGGTGLTYSTYLGGNGSDSGQAIALDTGGNAYVTGSTTSTNFPVAAPAATSTTYVFPYKSTLTGTAGNAFVAKLDPASNAQISITPSTLNFGNETVSVTSALLPITITNPSTAPLAITSISVAEVGNSVTVFTETDNCIGTYQGSSFGGTIPPGGGYCTIYVAFTPSATGTQSTTITLTDNAGGVAGAQQIINVTGFGTIVATSVTVNPSTLVFGSQAVGSVSAPQTVTITNTGTEVLNITNFSTGTSGDFSWTSPSCQSVSNTLQISQSCTVNVTFSPTASGTRTGLLSISDNATGSPQTVALTGTGAAAFTITSPSARNPAIIGDTETTFNLLVQGPSSFSGAISLACSAGTTTCSFSVNPVFIGTPTVLTISNLTTSLPNPYIFTVTGTSGSQTYSLQLNLGFEDYTLSRSPSIATVAAGGTAGYSIIVNPLYGFNQAIQLSCYAGLPPNSICSFGNGGKLTPTGTGPVTDSLSISTVRYVPPATYAVPRLPGGKLPPMVFGLLSLAALASLALSARYRRQRGWLGAGWLKLRLAMLCIILCLDLALVSCRSSLLEVTGTTTGNYTVTIYGTLISNTTVTRSTTLSLAVTASP